MGEEHLCASSPLVCLFPSTGPSTPWSHHPSPTRERSQRLLRLAATPVSTETWLHRAFDASFLSSPLPTLTLHRWNAAFTNSFKNKSVLEQWSLGCILSCPKTSDRAVTATHKVATSMRAICLRCTRSNATSTLKRVLGPHFVSMSIFETGLLLSLKTDFDQQSDKGKKHVANYLNPQDFRFATWWTNYYIWIKFKRIKNASGLVSFVLALRPKYVESVD